MFCMIHCTSPDGRLQRHRREQEWVTVWNSGTGPFTRLGNAAEEAVMKCMKSNAKFVCCQAFEGNLGQVTPHYDADASCASSD